jgi:hypothetical protein
MTAKELKNLAAQVRRTDTALRQLAGRLDLSDGDKKALLKAAMLLSNSGRKVGAQATRTKREEQARDVAIAKATQEAIALMADWPVETTLDKVALCIGDQLESNLRHDLQSKQTDLAWSLDYWVKQARQDIPAEAAWRSVRDSKPVRELMTLAREKFEQIRTRPGTIALTKRWQAGMEAQAVGAGEGHQS